MQDCVLNIPRRLDLVLLFALFRLTYGGSLIRPESTGFGTVYFVQNILKDQDSDLKVEFTFTMPYLHLCHSGLTAARFANKHHKRICSHVDTKTAHQRFERMRHAMQLILPALHYDRMTEDLHCFY